MKLSFSTLGCPGWNLERTAEKALEYGFDGVELRIDGKQDLGVDMTLGQKKYVKGLFSGRKIDISCISGYSFFCSNDKDELKKNQDLLLSYIDLAEDLEVKNIRTFIGTYPETSTEDEIAKSAADYLSVCGEKAEKKGVTILIETHHMFPTAAKVKKITDQINNQGIAILWDIFHSYRGNESPAKTIQILDEKIRHIHIKDANFDREGSEKLCLAGEGVLPVKEVVSRMLDKKFKGHFSLEWEKMWIKELEEPEVVFPHYVKYMRSLVK
jgi:sugar phosphate isomerase/epimerase